MSKRKKHPRLPSGWGCIRYLGEGRSNPYAVHPPCTDDNITINGYSRPKAICYVNDWYVGFSVLAAYRAGTYKPGDEIFMSDDLKNSKLTEKEMDSFCRRIIANCQVASNTRKDGKTFKEVYEEFYEWKFGENAARKLSEQSRQAIRTGFLNLKAIHDRPMCGLKVNDLQKVVNDCPLKEASIELMLNCMKQMYKYAVSRDIVEKDISLYVVKPQRDGDEHGVPFTEDDIKKLWTLQDDPTAEFLLIMCYSGFRIRAYQTIEINLEEGYFQGGIKTKAGKGRIVPIHSFIMPLVKRRLEREKKFAPSYSNFRVSIKNFLTEHGMEVHTAHDCRHTFSMLCEKYGVNESDRKRLLGHSFGADITNGIYGHRTVEELRSEIEKITLHNTFLF